MEEQHSKEYVTLKEYFEAIDKSTDFKIKALEKSTTASIEALEKSINSKIDALEKSINSKIDALEKSFNNKHNTLEGSTDLKYNNIEKNTTLAAKSIDRRLEGMNEFRDALKDQTAKFLTKDEFNTLHNRVEEDIKVLRENKAMLEGKASMTSVYIAYGIGLIGLIIALLGIFIK